MRARISAAIILVIASVVSGCAAVQPSFSVRVDSISGGAVDKTSYILLPGNKDTKAEDLQFKEYAAYVNRALINRGLYLRDHLRKPMSRSFLCTVSVIPKSTNTRTQSQRGDKQAFLHPIQLGP